MPLDFPTSQTLNEIYTFGGRSWKWNGTAWDSYNPDAENVVDSLNGITGAINLAAGSNITITPSGLTLTIASTGGGAGFTRSINVITSSTTAGGTASVDYVYIGNTSGNINLTLPTAVSNTNRYTVKNSNIGVLSIYTTSSQTIDGSTFYNLTTQYQAVDLLSNNSNWFIV